jgi:hypothetical protein
MKTEDADFDAITNEVLGVAAPQDKDGEEQPARRLSSCPSKKRGMS